MLNCFIEKKARPGMKKAKHRNVQSGNTTFRSESTIYNTPSHACYKM